MASELLPDYDTIRVVKRAAGNFFDAIYCWLSPDFFQWLWKVTSYQTENESGRSIFLLQQNSMRIALNEAPLSSEGMLVDELDY